MSQKRAGRIAESIKTLKKLEERYRGRPEIARIQALRILRDNPSCTIEEVATAVNYSRQSVTRWLKVYREKGLDALLQLDGRKRLGEADEALGILRARLSAGEFYDLESVKKWIDEYSDSDRQASSNENSGKKTISGRKIDVASDANRTIDRNSPQPKTLDEVLEFIATIRTTTDIHEWAESFREGLRVFLGNVDLLAVAVNCQCSITGDPAPYNLAVTQTVISESNTLRSVMEHRDNREEAHLDRLYEVYRQRKFAFDKYHPPRGFIYYHNGESYLGAIILWRERDKPVISEQTIELVERMRYLLTLLISNFVASHQLARPNDHMFSQTIEYVVHEAELTTQERRVLYLQLLGLPYEEIADTLKVSLNTIRTHVQAIYRKAGVHSQAELFAKYFTPRIDSPKTHK